MLHVQTHPLNSKVQKLVSGRNKGRIIGNCRSYRPKIWFIQAKNILFLSFSVKRALEVGQPEVLFLYCHFPQCVRPGTSHLVIYSVSPFTKYISLPMLRFYDSEGETSSLQLSKSELEHCLTPLFSSPL